MEKKKLTQEEKDVLVIFMSEVLEKMEYDADVQMYTHNGDAMGLDPAGMKCLLSAVMKVCRNK